VSETGGGIPVAVTVDAVQAGHHLVVDQVPQRGEQRASLGGGKVPNVEELLHVVQAVWNLQQAAQQGVFGQQVR
jgi:hypothetical protein